MLNRVEVILEVVEDATNVENGETALLVVLLFGVGATVELKQKQVVIEGLQTLI